MDMAQAYRRRLGVVVMERLAVIRVDGPLSGLELHDSPRRANTARRTVIHVGWVAADIECELLQAGS